MLRLLIADDEKIIRETVRTFIDWKSLNIEVVATCKNGLEAYDAILDEYPDIVLTDIRMPKLSGLELIQRITQTHDNIEFIILSGYSEFSYAKEAMKYGIKHYLLKPCNEQQIIDAVLDAAREHYEKLSLKTMKEHMETFTSQLHKSLMKNIIVEMLSSDDSIDTLSSTYEGYLDFSQVPYELCYLYFLEEPFVEPCMNQIQNYVLNLEADLFLTFLYVKNTLIFLFRTGACDYSVLDSFLQTLAFPGQATESVYQRVSYASLQELLATLIGKVKRYETITMYSDGHGASVCNYNSIFSKVSAISQKLSMETDETAHSLWIEELKKLLLTIKDIDLLRSLISSLLLGPDRSASSFTTAEATELLTFVSSADSNEEICRLFFEKLGSIYALSSKKTAGYKPFIEEIIAYMEEHLSDPNLTLKWIVENHLYMNVDYVSKQFVKQTGTKFSTYLNEIRIKKAKSLLLNCDSEKIYHVAEQIGCGNNPQYFSQLFKKYTKMTPSEYIQKMNG